MGDDIFSVGELRAPTSSQVVKIWFWNSQSGGVRVRLRVRFQAVKVPIFSGFPVP